MAKKLKLEVDYFEDYHLFSIATQMKDYKLAFHINQALNIELKKYSDLKISDKSGTYPWFHFSAGGNYPTYYLIGNNHPDGKINRSQRGIDYYLLIKELMDEELLTQYAGALRQIPGILGVFITDMHSVKNLELMIESVELHEMDAIVKPAKRTFS